MQETKVGILKDELGMKIHVFLATHEPNLEKKLKISDEYQSTIELQNLKDGQISNETQITNKLKILKEPQIMNGPKNVK